MKNWNEIASEEMYKVGDYVTVLFWHPLPVPVLDEKSSDVKVKLEVFNNQSYVGNCLHIKVIDYPFIRATIQNAFKHNRKTITIDLRACELKHLSDDFVQSVLSDIKS